MSFDQEKATLILDLLKIGMQSYEMIREGIEMASDDNADTEKLKQFVATSRANHERVRREWEGV